jgi:hypothetical protein
MFRWSSICLIALAFAGSACAASMKDLEWIVGTWTGTLGGSAIEEQWTPATGGSMAGTFRVVAKGKAKFYEMLAIEDSSAGPVMLIRHFKPGLVALEEKDGAFKFALESARNGWAVFVNKSTTPPEKLTYAAEGKSGMLVRLEKTEEGKPSVSEFRFKRR